jgi:hypothetical protein
MMNGQKNIKEDCVLTEDTVEHVSVTEEKGEFVPATEERKEHVCVTEEKGEHVSVIIQTRQSDTVSYFLDFAHRKIKKKRRFGSRLCFLLQVKKRLTWCTP